MFAMWVLAVCMEMTSFCWTYSALRPLAMRKNISVSRGESL